MLAKLSPWVALLLTWLPGLSFAHFQTLIPTSDIIHEHSERSVQLEMAFTHPMLRGPVMEMGDPLQFGVLGPNGREDLLPRLEPYKIVQKQYFKAEYRFNRPGDYIFYIAPAPYWESSEGVMISHYTKVIVGAYAGPQGWDQRVGFPVEIDPLTRPYGLWTGNLFQGVVIKQGNPVPFAKVEIEWLNDGSITPSSDPYVTQIIKADANGTFSYSLPHQGWWGFAALIEGSELMKNPLGESVPVEQGAVIWIHTRDMKSDGR
jgi:cobalt/nickel transport protein